MEQKNFVRTFSVIPERLEGHDPALRELAPAEAAPENEHTELGQVISGLKAVFRPRRSTRAGASTARSQSSERR